MGMTSSCLCSFFFSCTMFLSCVYFASAFPFWQFPYGSNGKECTWNEGDPGLMPESERSSGEGNGSPLQYPCLENSMDRGVWWAMVHKVSKSQTWLKQLSKHACTHKSPRKHLLHGYLNTGCLFPTSLKPPWRWERGLMVPLCLPLA